ncbi:MAG: alpha/beta hydrolase [Rubrivivax sp.]|nr:alpha/beta hydrolase [Rubrivivax sp.]
MPPLIALPGTLLDARSLQPVLQAAGLQAQVELLGQAPTLDAELDRLAALAASGPGPALWIGHSLGGIVALHLAVRHPQAVAGLLLLGANGRSGAATPARRRAAQAQWALAGAKGLAALAHDKLAPGYGVDGDAALVAQLAAQAQAVGLARFGHQLHYAATRPGVLDPRQALDVPVLALSGAADTLCPPDQSEALLALGLRVRHRSLPAAGHLFPMLQAQATAQLFAAWLRQSHF